MLVSLSKQQKAQMIYDALVSLEPCSKEDLRQATGLTVGQFEQGWAEVKDAVLEATGRTLGMEWAYGPGYPWGAYLWSLPDTLGTAGEQGTTAHRINFRMRSLVTQCRRLEHEISAAVIQYPGDPVVTLLRHATGQFRQTAELVGGMVPVA